VVGEPRQRPSTLVPVDCRDRSEPPVLRDDAALVVEPHGENLVRVGAVLGVGERAGVGPNPIHRRHPLRRFKVRRGGEDHVGRDSGRPRRIQRLRHQARFRQVLAGGT